MDMTIIDSFCSLVEMSEILDSRRLSVFFIILQRWVSFNDLKR